jgi:hypothetical protein
MIHRRKVARKLGTLECGDLSQLWNFSSALGAGLLTSPNVPDRRSPEWRGLLPGGETFGQMRVRGRETLAQHDRKGCAQNTKAVTSHRSPNYRSLKSPK